MALAAAAISGITVSKLHPHVGAEITGVDLREPLDDASFEVIREAWNQHSVLVLRDQRIDDDQQVAFARRFGALEETTFTVAADNPYIYRLSNVDDEGNVLPVGSKKRLFLDVNARWHTDSSFRPTPAMGSILSGRKVPAREHGDTAFASMRVGYETLRDERKHALEDLVAVHDYSYSVSLFGDKLVPRKKWIRSHRCAIRWCALILRPVSGACSSADTSNASRGCRSRKAAPSPPSSSSGAPGPSTSTGTAGASTTW